MTYTLTSVMTAADKKSGKHEKMNSYQENGHFDSVAEQLIINAINRTSL